MYVHVTPVVGGVLFNSYFQYLHVHVIEETRKLNIFRSEGNPETEEFVLHAMSSLQGHVCTGVYALHANHKHKTG